MLFSSKEADEYQIRTPKFTFTTPILLWKQCLCKERLMLLLNACVVGFIQYTVTKFLSWL